MVLYTFKSATVPLGTPGRVQSTCLGVLYSCCLGFFFFQGTYILYLRNLRDLCSSLFTFVFRNPFFTKQMYQKVSQWSTKTTQNHKPLQKLIIETHPQSRPSKCFCLQEVKPLKSSIVLYFQQFFQRPRASKKKSK